MRRQQLAQSPECSKETADLPAILGQIVALWVVVKRHWCYQYGGKEKCCFQQRIENNIWFKDIYI